MSPSPTPSLKANEAIDAEDAGSEQEDHPKQAASPTTKKNAFDTLMSSPSRKKNTNTVAHPPKRHKISSALWTPGGSTSSSNDPTQVQHESQRDSQYLTRPSRNGLGLYTVHPEKHSSGVVSYNDDFVVIKDRYPKSSVHLLILPRTRENTLHPFVAFRDQSLLDATRVEAERVRVLVAGELRRMFGGQSKKERERRAAIDAGQGGEEDGGELPPGRDWEKEVMIGIHAGPSMNHLHVHVLSRDRMSECLKHRKHYNSFNTSFFVGLEELPLAKDDPRWAKDRGGGLSEDMKCWRCGKGFVNKFAQLKVHLQEEFEEWKRE